MHKCINKCIIYAGADVKFVAVSFFTFILLLRTDINNNSNNNNNNNHHQRTR